MRQTLPAALLGLLLGACAYDPFDKPGSWQPAGLNNQNLARMVADPAHLTRGIGTDHERAANAVRPIERLDAGQRESLPAARASAIGFVGAN